MTIFKPNYNKSLVSFFAVMILTILVGGFFYVLEYNSLVNARYQVSSLQQKIADAQTSNYDLRNKLYQMTDPVTLEALAGQYNLTLDRQPGYISQYQWVSDSSH